MEVRTMDIHERAGEAYDWFETAKRPTSDESFTRLRNGAPQWVQHGDLLPDDWRYEAIRAALGAIHDLGEGTDLDDFASEWADQQADAYTAARFQWLASNLERQAYCDDAVSEGLVAPEAGIAERVGIGQFMEAREVFESVRQSLAALDQ
jgi:hypothetical protein